MQWPMPWKSSLETWRFLTAASGTGLDAAAEKESRRTQGDRRCVDVRSTAQCRAVLRNADRRE
jgi:hypothetical protein